MKRLLTHIFPMVVSVCLVSSCIFEEFDQGEKIPSTVSLQLSFPTTSQLSKAPIDSESSTDADKPENGNKYENTIPNASAVKLFLFDLGENGKLDDNATYIAEIKGFTMDFAEEEYKLIKGQLPENLYAKHLRIVFMANYTSRMFDQNDQNDPNLIKPVDGETFNDWRATTEFVYSTVTTNKTVTHDLKDKKYIPMSGYADFEVQPGNNFVRINVTRALAKVRLRVKPSSPYGIKSIVLAGTAGKSYCIQQKNGTQPKVPLYGKADDKTFNVSVQPGDTIEFYVAEQTAQEKNNISFVFFDPKKEDTNLKPGQQDPSLVGGRETIYFKDYSRLFLYPVERNFIYQFNLSKKQVEDSKVDVTTTIQPWTVVDLNTQFE